jgi:D-alanyl-D-alanine carboxypeptidase/D-alanyl-D-alanine-endopeptidase (penicillin-binding protein 4)
VRRGWVAPTALGVIAIVSAALALRAPSTPAAGPARPAVKAAVLSPRRVPVLLAAAIADGRLHRALDRVVRDPDLGDGRDNSCLVVQRAGDTLYSTAPERAFTPASTLKLLTALAALRKLGADSRVETKVVASAAPANGDIGGNLWLVGGGDPLLGTADYAASFDDQPRLFSDLADLADRVVRAGVRHVAGRVIGDESRYDGQRYVPTWKPGYAVDGDVGPLSALAVDDGFTAWKPRAVAAAAPATHAAAVFADLLKARGVTVDGEAGEGAAPRAARTVATLESLPLHQIVGEMLVHSDNESAELLTKELGFRFGGKGTTTAGVGVIRTTLQSAGVNVGAVHASDGSGLDPADTLTCDVLAHLLAGPNLAALNGAGLAVAGRTGTLFDRFKANPAADRLRAKTGALEGVVGLAGLVDASVPGQPAITFAYLANRLPRPSEARGRRAQERLGAALAAYPDGPSAESLAP